MNTIDMHYKRKQKRIFHVNMLKEFHVHRPAETSHWTEEVSEDDSNVPMWNDNPKVESSVGDHLSESQKEQISVLQKNFADVFKNQPGRTNLAEHQPVQLPPYQLPQTYRETVAKELKAMEQSGIIEKSNSEWASPIVLDRKKDGSIRICVDYRRSTQLSFSH